MFFLVTESKNKDKGLAWVSFFKTKNELDKVLGNVNSPFYVYKLGVQLEKKDFVQLFEDFKNISVNEVLEAEAAKFCKKKYNTELDCILDHVIQIG